MRGSPIATNPKTRDETRLSVIILQAPSKYRSRKHETVIRCMTVTCSHLCHVAPTSIIVEIHRLLTCRLTIGVVFMPITDQCGSKDANVSRHQGTPIAMTECVTRTVMKHRFWVPHLRLTCRLIPKRLRLSTEAKTKPLKTRILLFRVIPVQRRYAPRCKWFYLRRRPLLLLRNWRFRWRNHRRFLVNTRG